MGNSAMEKRTRKQIMWQTQEYVRDGRDTSLALAKCPGEVFRVEMWIWLYEYGDMHMGHLAGLYESSAQDWESDWVMEIFKEMVEGLHSASSITGQATEGISAEGSRFWPHSQDQHLSLLKLEHRDFGRVGFLLLKHLLIGSSVQVLI